MHRVHRHSLILFLSLLALAQAARADTLVTDISKDRVAISSIFAGAELLLYGTIDRDPSQTGPRPRNDIVVILRGPTEELVVREKERTAGIWVNRKSVEFALVPSFYFLASTRRLEDIGDVTELRAREIGIRYLRMRPKRSAPASALTPVGIAEALAGNLNRYRAAVIRNKKREGLYREIEGSDEEGVRFRSGSLFRAKLKIPANVPVGNHTAEVHLLRDGKIISTTTKSIYIHKTGVERSIYQFAHRQPFLYGIAAVLTALFAGWIASVAFRNS